MPHYAIERKKGVRMMYWTAVNCKVCEGIIFSLSRFAFYVPPGKLETRAKACGTPLVPWIVASCVGFLGHLLGSGVLR